MIVFSLLSEAFDVVFYGLLATAALMAVLYAALKMMSEGIVRSIPFYITGVVLFPLLAVQFSLLIGAMQVRAHTDVIELKVNQMVEGIYGTLNANDSQLLMDELTENMPLLGVYLDTADFSGHTYETAASVIASTIREYITWYAVRRLLWILGFTIVGGFIAMMYDKGPGMKNDRLRRRERKSYASQSRNERRPRRCR